MQRSQTNVYNNQGWLAGVSADARFDAGGGASLNQQLAVSYQFDASGNRVQISNAPAGGAAAETGSYSYDASGRMLSGRDDKRNEVVNSLSYDGFGNRISESRTGETAPTTTPFTSYSYDANNRVLSSSAGEAWGYDANGNTVSQTSRDGSTSSTAFNAENRSTTSSSTSDGKTTTSSSAYDAAGNVTSSRVDGDGFGFTEVTQRDVRYLEVRKDITQSWAKGAARLEGATSFSYDANGNLAFLDRGRNQKTGQNSVAYFDYDLEGQIIGRADKASAQTNAAFFAGYAADPDGVAASGDGDSGFSGFSFFNSSETQKVQRQLFGSQFASSASTGLQNYLYANNKPISQASGNQSLALKKLTLQGGQPIEAPIDPATGQPGASTGSRLVIEEINIVRTAGVIDRTATARNIAARAYAGDPGYAQLSTAAQAKVIAYIQAQLPPDAELVAGATVTLHAFILMVDASYTGLAQITDYSLRQLGSDGIPGGTVQSHVVRAGDTLQTIAQIYFGSPAYWYLIADANGLSGSERLAEGVTLTIPNKIANSANSAQTFKVYNESEVIGSTSPEIRTVAKKKKWWQKLIQIIIIVIMVVVAIVVAIYAPQLLAQYGAVVGSLYAAAFGATAYAAASVVTQGLAIAAGLQESFSWKAVGKAAVTGAVSGVAAGLVGSIGKDVATGWQVAARVGIEAGKQVILEGKITNVAGLVGAAASGGAFGNGTIGTAIANNSRTFSAGLAILENVARGRDNNALNWVGLATSAFFDAGDRQQSAAAAASEQSSLDSQVESYQAIASTSQQGASSQYFDRAGNVNWTNVAVQAVGTVVISNRLGSEAAINYFGNALGSAVSENAYAQVQRDETRNPSSASYRNEMDRESDSYTPASAYSYRNGMDVESDGATNLNAVIYAFGQDYSGLRQPGLQYAANDVMDATQPRVVSDAGPLGGTPTSGVSRDPFARDYENSFDDGSGMTTLMKDAPLRIFNNTANVYTTENLTAMPGWQIQGAGSKVLAEGMTNMGGYRDASTGQWSPYGEETVSAGIDAMVQTRGVSYEYANEHYAKFYEQTIIRERAVSDAGKELVPMLSMSAANGLPDNSAHMASPEQLRFGKMVGDSLGGLDPVFGALLSPTGGIPGAGNARVTNSLAIGLAGGLDAVTNHGIAHDAAGYLLNYHQMGPGYQYVPNFKGWISTTSPLSGQQGGLNFYNNLKLYGTPTAPFNQNQF